MFGEDIAGFGGYSVATAEQCRDDCAERADCYGFVVANCSSPPTCRLKGGNGKTNKSACSCYGKNIPKPTPVNMMSQVDKYISYILGHQNADGWLGPEGSGGDQYWGPSNVLQSLWQWSEAKKATDPVASRNASQVQALRRAMVAARMP